MIKKTKIPKYTNGTPGVETVEQKYKNPWSQMTFDDRLGSGINAATTAANLAFQSAGKSVTAKDVVMGGLSGAATGAAIGGVPGAIIGGAGGVLLSSIGTGGSVNEATGEITNPSGIAGIFGHSKSYLRNKSNRIKTSLADQQLTQDLNYNFYSDPNNSMNGSIFAAAEGGIVPGEHYASRREVEVAADGTNAVRYPWDPDGKDTYHVYANPDGSSAMGNYVFTEEGVRRPNGEKYSDAAEKIIKGTKEGSKLRQISLRKLADEMEEQKMNKGIKKIKKGIPAHEEGLNPYSYNKNLTEFAYWDKDKNEYKKEYLDWVKNLTEQDVRDIEAGKYGDMSEYFSKNKGKKLDIATAQRLMTDKKYGNWHKIGKAVVDKKITDKKQEPFSSQPIKMKITGTTMYQDTHPGNYPIDYEVSPVTMDLKKVANPSLADAAKRVRQKERKQSFKDFLSNTGDIISDSIPMLGAMFGNYDYHTEQPQISSYRYIPTGVSIEPVRSAANESYAMARYNQTNFNPNTGAGMAYGLQAASNRAKTLADAYAWQQDAQNKLIAQNVGIYNDWAKRYDAARYQAIADTRANEGAAQQMKDSAIRDALEFTQGRRNDRMRLAMMEPLAKYAFDDDTYKKIYSRAIV